MKFTLSTPSTPLRDAFYVGLSVLLCFIASAYFIYNQASARNNLHNRQQLEAIAWRTANLVDEPSHEKLALTPPSQLDPKEYVRLQEPARNTRAEETILSRVYTVAFDKEIPKMVVDSEGFPPRTWERLPQAPGESGDFTKETLYFCALSVMKTGKGWVGEIAYPGSQESFVVAIVPIFSSPGHPSSVLVVESTADRLQPTLASLRSAAISSVVIGAIVSFTVALAVYSYRRRNLVDANLLVRVTRDEGALIDAIGEAIYRLEPESEEISWQGNLQDLGWPDSDNVPRTRSAWLATVHPEDLELFRAARGEKARDKWNVEYRIFAHNGRINWLLDRGQHLDAEGSRKPLAVGTILNLTPLREIERRLRDVVDAAGEYIWEVDASGHYTYLSERVEDVLGYPVEALIGRHPLSLVPPEDHESVSKQSLEILSKRQVFRDFEHRMVRGDGAVIWLSVNGVPVLSATGEISGYRGAGLEITARKTFEQALVREKEAAQAADRAKSEFLAVMSHEIRTPLNSVLGFADLLGESSLDSDQKEQVEMIQRSGDALLVLLNDILDFSRIESGKMPIQPSSVEIRGCLRDVADLYQATAQSKGLTLNLSVDEEVPESLCTDPGRLRQILLNLIGNAVKFTASGGVFITAKEGGPAPGDGRFPLLVEVADSGIGIPPDRIGRLFKPFSQADSSTTRRFGGTGLGLVISKRLSELLGGDVSLVKSSSEGSVFALSLPLVTVPRDEEAQRPTLDVNALTPELVKSAPCRLLVVEDNPVNSMLAQRMLASLGFESESRTNGLLGIEAYKQDRFDIIFMDLQMPVMDGLEATRAIRQFEVSNPADVPAYIVALTADAMAGDRDRCLQAGMDDYLSKPIRRSELSAVLRRACETILSTRSLS